MPKDKEDWVIPIANTPAHNALCITFCPDLERKDFCRVQPWHSQPGSAKDKGVEVHHGRGSRTPFACRGCITIGGCIKTQYTETSDKEHGNSLANRTPPQSPAPSYAIECVDTDERSKHVEDVIKSGNPLGLCVVNPAIPKIAAVLLAKCHS